MSAKDCRVIDGISRRWCAKPGLIGANVESREGLGTVALAQLGGDIRVRGRTIV
jgi:hypothetical protein